MKEAYKTTINDLQIAISNCSWWEFDLINEYTLEIEKYRRLIKKLKENEK
jgi:hydrogenase maturation factor